MQKIIDAIDGTVMNIFNLLTIETPAIKKAISSGHIIIIVLVSIAILLSAITIIRQQKIIKMLRDLTPPKAKPPREEEASAKEPE